MKTLAFVFILSFALCGQAFDCQLNLKDPYKVEYTITVDQNGKGNFKTIQNAIDSIPAFNKMWIRISILTGRYLEQVTIPKSKPCIFLEGAGSPSTTIEWDAHAGTDTSATFTSYPENFVAKGITFKNSYNLRAKNPVIPAVAARIYGDKSALYHCAFVGLQDTLWDTQGRHYYHKCYIEGGVDFIWGAGQSIFENCVINLNIGTYAQDRPAGVIAAQGRNSSSDPSGFVFKTCIFGGVGKANIGRAYGYYSRVIIHKSNLTDFVLPEGWDAWNKETERLTFVEADNVGPGANTDGRVKWIKKLSYESLKYFLDISFIDNEGWLAKLPRVF
ncbi:hypothetical protein SLE2022_331520 [Rubroshorea leprosula]